MALLDKIDMLNVDRLLVVPWKFVELILIDSIGYPKDRCNMKGAFKVEQTNWLTAVILFGKEVLLF